MPQQSAYRTDVTYYKTMKRISKKVFVTLTTLLCLFLLPAISHAGGLGDAGRLFVETGERAYGGQPADLGNMFASVARSALTLMGMLFIGLTIYGGFLWMTAGGSTDKVQKAKDTLTQAVIGIAIVLMTRGIAEFVIRTVFEATGA